jgi:SAM-dependent methyltransferase
VPINIRSPEQWSILCQVYDFDGKEVLDVGCGHGDLLVLAKQAGAYVIGVDNNKDIVPETRGRNLPVMFQDLEYYLAATISQYDAAFCFSVLPYVKNPDRVLRGLHYVAETVFVEWQMRGDGPGTLTEEQIFAKLSEHWGSVKKIGFTVVEYRGTKRPIWMCRKGEG